MIVAQIPKQPWEEILTYIDFSGDLATGESISSVDSITARNARTGADTSSTILHSDPHTITSPRVYKKVKAGAVGEIHIVQMRVITNLGNRLEHELRLNLYET